MNTHGPTGINGQVRELLEEHLIQAMTRILAADTPGASRATKALHDVIERAQDAMSWSPDEQRRRGFLQELMVHLATLGPDRLSWQLQTVQPFGVTGCVVTGRGLPGAAQVLITATNASATGTKRHYATFPPGGELQYELRITTGPADGWASRPALQRHSADAAEIAAIIIAWRDATPLPPVTIAPRVAADLLPLQKRAAAARAVHDAARMTADWETLGLHCTFDRHVPPAELTAAAAARLAADLAALRPAELLANVPRDAKGQLALGVTVALDTYATVAPQPRGRQYWLVAQTPARRRDPQVVTLALMTVTGSDQRHRWDQSRWLWTADSADEATRWGVAGLDTANLSLSDGAQHLAALRQRQETATLTAAEQATLAILLQDAGELLDACAACGVEVAGEVGAILAGGAGWNLTNQQAEQWPQALQIALCAAAPWRFASLLAAEEARLAAWVAEKPGRRRKPARLRLLSLPQQPSINKASLMLAWAATSGAPRLEIEWTGSTVIEPEVHWQRATSLDLRRFGLER